MQSSGHYNQSLNTTLQSQQSLKMQIDDANLLKQKYQKITLESIQITPSQFDVEFSNEYAYSSKQLFAEITLKNITKQQITYQIRSNQVSNYDIEPQEGILLSRENVQVKITVKNMDEFNVLQDRIFVRAAQIEYDFTRKMDAKKMWRDGNFLASKQIEEKSLVAKIHKDIMKFKSPKKSNAKQKFISDFFYTSGGTQNNLLQSTFPSQNTNNNNNQVNSSQQSQQSQQIFQSTVKSFHFNHQPQFYQQKTQYLTDSQNGVRNRNTNTIGSSHRQSQRVDQNSTIQSQLYYSTVDKNNLNEEIILKQQYEQLLIKVDEQEKQMSQLDVERKRLFEQIQQMDLGKKRAKKHKNRKEKLKNIKSDSVIETMESSEEGMYEDYDDDLSNCSDSEDAKKKGVQLWKAICFILLMYFIGFYFGGYKN